jgi:hypothetical protein
MNEREKNNMNEQPKIVGKCVCCQKDQQEITFPLCSKECLKNEWRSQNFLHLAELAKKGGRKKWDKE